MASEPKESPANNPGLQTTLDEATKGYFMQQTMYRIKDPKISLDFYSRVLGMSNWGTESDPDVKGYHNGNSEPRGFGKMKDIAFIKDPDGYWIEIFDLKTIGKTTSSAA
ncbi:hypothetical protein GH714_015006 [Hevea brasiliensis]|uniref:VOC domain-containing protein n=1 Tax=Hevea brasiliensis TaxID=3981 RepID=A0A6A6LGT1_HEVBR|nr:hypothetical protein GH714_015006 [Hevea brasiliensis]